MAKKENPESLFDIFREIELSEFAQLYLFAGEQFQRDTAREALVDALTDEASRAFNLDMLDGEEVTLDEIINCISTLPMMGTRRVVVVTHSDRLQLKAKSFTRIAGSLARTTVLILSGEKLDKRNLKGIPSSINLRCFMFSIVYENNLRAWLRTYLKFRGLRIDNDTLDYIFECEGNNLATIAAEIDKIVTILGDRTKITIDDTRKIIGQFREFRGTDLADTITSGKCEKALKILHSLIENQKKPTSLLFDMMNYFTMLGMYIDFLNERISEAELFRLTGRKLFWHKMRFGEKVSLWNNGRTRKALVLLTNLDSKLKKTGTTERHLFEMLLIDLTKLTQNRIP